jgi:hypothetical protein
LFHSSINFKPKAPVRISLNDIYLDFIYLRLDMYMDQRKLI